MSEERRSLPGQILTSHPGEYSQRLRQMQVRLHHMTFNHLTGRARNFDWFVNSFIMAVYDIFFKFNKNFLSQSTTKKFLTDNHCKSICNPARSACSSCRE